MGFKKMTVVLPAEIVNLFQPLWDEMDNEELDGEGKAGGVFMDIHHRTGECTAVFVPAKEYHEIQSFISKMDS